MRQPNVQSAQRHPLTLLLGNQGNVRVLRELCLHGAEMSAPRIAREAGLSAHGARLALGYLSALDVVETVGEGRSLVYRINRHHPMTPALCALFTAERARYDAVLDALRNVLMVDSVVSAWAYGSFARGEDRQDSDIDIAVLMAESQMADHEGDRVEEIREALNEAGARLHFQPSVVELSPSDVVRLRTTKDPWWMDLVRDAVVLKGRPPTVVAREVKGHDDG